jgi:hypothetical protein
MIVDKIVINAENLMSTAFQWVSGAKKNTRPKMAENVETVWVKKLK